MVIFWIFICMFLFFPGLIFFDYVVVQKLSEENKFKKWWRKHLIADYN